MSEITRSDVAAGQREIRADARLERRLIWKALIAIALVAVVVVARELFLR